jgi:hypothetical protein
MLLISDQIRIPLSEIEISAIRAQGSGGYAALRRARLLRYVSVEVRELVIERIRKARTLAPVVDRNWVVAPDVVWDTSTAATSQ